MAGLHMELDNSYKAETTSLNQSTLNRSVNRRQQQQRDNKRRLIRSKIPRKCSNQQERKKFRISQRRHPMKSQSTKIGGTNEQKIKSKPSVQIISQRSSLSSSTSISSTTTLKNTQNNPKDTLRTLTLVPLDKTAVLTAQDCLHNSKSPESPIILKFQERKAYSQMDFTQARRIQNNPLTVLVKHNQLKNPDNSLALKHFAPSSDTTLNDERSSYDLDKMYSSENFYYALHETDCRISGMRVFATIMLNAWRKRRNEVKRLMEEINEMKRMSVKTKNQLHVFSTLFRVEQKRSDELNTQLKRSLDDINMTKNSCESLTTSLISAKADKALLEQQLHIKEQEYDDLNTMYSQAKTDLFNAMGQQRELQSNLSMEQRKVQQLENQKNELINEIFELNSEFSEKEKNLLDVIKVQEDELDALKKTLNDTEAKANIFKDSREALIKNHLIMEENMKKEIERLHNEMSELQARLDVTVKDTMKGYLKKSLKHQQTLFQIVHCFVYCLLPSTPPPQMYPISFNICLRKALSIIKR